MKDNKLTAKNLTKAGTFLMWSALGVVCVAGVPVIFSSLKINWYVIMAAIVPPICKFIWEWAKKQIETVAAAAEANKEAIASKFELLNNRLDRLTIQQQADEKLQERQIEQQIEIEKLKTEINYSERLRFVEQSIYRVINKNEKNTNH